ncbi:DNA translocase FtsK [Bacillus sp. FJAT-50079]|uniref:DNA translocase FtsK n=1 Tax=Bacillus sp. FJAT-50079 TaxID=2833577 RepID=UPI001BC8DD7E|nr:DNA translocase FtsK [Bacillus sp. FJAT-50079]MBS4208700.1 DUF87 domain-containing protein [Bacillus sp. FJAT-50079]
MSWLKRIFSKWNIEDEHEEFQEQRENKQQYQQLEMKTKMTYKYPTGQYRFPLIQDRPMRPSSNSKRSSEQSMEKNEQPQVQEKKQDSRPVSRTIQPKNIQPFKPAEIPSPIYGFQRPVKRKKKEYEFELEHSFIDIEDERTLAKDNPKTRIEECNSIEMLGKNEKRFEEVEAILPEEKPEYWTAEQSRQNEEEHLEIEQIDENEKSEYQDVKVYSSKEEEDYKEPKQKEEEHLEAEPIHENKESDYQEVFSSKEDLGYEQPEHSHPNEEENFEAEQIHGSEESDYQEVFSSKEDLGYEQPEHSHPNEEENFEAEQIHENEESDYQEVFSSKEDLGYEQPEHSHPNEEENFEAEQIHGSEESDYQEVFSSKEDLGYEQSEHSHPNEEENFEVENEIEEAEINLQNDTKEDETNEVEYVEKFKAQREDENQSDENVEAKIEEIEVKEETELEVITDRTEDEQTEMSHQNDGEQNSQEDNSSLEKAASTRTSTENKRRAHLPFNVLMLKEDRRKWEEREKQRSERTEVLKEQKVDENNPIIVEEKQTEPSPVQMAMEEVAITAEETVYQFPELKLLHPPIIKSENREWLDEQSALLDETLKNFNVNANVVHVSQGPAVTRFEVQPEPGVKVSRVKNLTDDIKLSMAAKDIRMEAPIPGKRSIGIELPNAESRPVQISEIIGNPVFLQAQSPLTAVLGLDISGAPVVTDLNKMPHGLIAGATGSGKSVCINSILVSLLYKARPDEVKLLLIDPKMVELAPYNHIPHLISPVITDVKAATAALKWTVEEMERRYELFAHASVRDISRFNEIAEMNGQPGNKLPFIVVVIDELADLMMMAPADVEESICRIAQKARACGIHLLIATQRPSVDVITGLIKANVPTRIAFSVSSQIDSRTIIDISGAEKLLGRGDMLFLESGTSKPIRLQGTYVSDEEIDHVIEHARSQGKPHYLFEQEELLKKAQIQEDEDELFLESCEFVVSQGSASTSLLQRQFRIGYNRAARLIDMLEQRGIISEARGSRPRDVLISEAELEKQNEI